MRVEPVAPSLAWSEFVAVRLLRRWAAARATGGNPLPPLVELAAELGEAPQLAIALHSLYQLLEGCLARPLVAECCCSPSLSGDERSVLTLLASAPDGPLPRSSPLIPHGLPGALLWAVRTVRLLAGISARPARSPRPAVCPFPVDRRVPRL